jgi:hypothetical protein
MLEYNEMMPILSFSQPPVAPKPGEGGSTPRSRTLSESAISLLQELLQTTFDRMK